MWKKKACREDEWECAPGCVEGKRVPQAREPGVLRLSFLPGRHFISLSYCTLNRKRAFLAVFFKPPWFLYSLLVGVF